jgi:hypothetical protein
VQLLDDIVDWSAPINNFKKNLQRNTPELSLLHGMQAMSVVQPNDIILPQNATAETILLRNQLMGLTRAVRHFESAKVHNVYANVEMAACGLTWTCHPSWGEIENITSVNRVMDR